MPTYKNQTLKIYNSLSGEKETFQSIHDGNVGMYVCGPTVYSNVHLGNVRTFMSFDVIFRYLLHLGFKVRYVRNITDVGHIVDDSDDDEKIDTPLPVPVPVPVPVESVPVPVPLPVPVESASDAVVAPKKKKLVKPKA